MRTDPSDLEPLTRAPALGLRTWLVLAAIAAGLVTAIGLAVARPPTPFTPEECQLIARFAKQSAEIRDLGADVEKHALLLHKHYAEAGVRLMPLLERELRRIYRERRPPEKAELDTYERCMTLDLLKEG